MTAEHCALMLPLLNICVLMGEISLNAMCFSQCRRWGYGRMSEWVCGCGCMAVGCRRQGRVSRGGSWRLQTTPPSYSSGTLRPAAGHLYPSSGKGCTPSTPQITHHYERWLEGKVKCVSLPDEHYTNHMIWNYWRKIKIINNHSKLKLQPRHE